MPTMALHHLARQRKDAVETGELDLALGADVDEAPGVRRIDLRTEGFACSGPH